MINDSVTEAQRRCCATLPIGASGRRLTRVNCAARRSQCVGAFTLPLPFPLIIRLLCGTVGRLQGAPICQFTSMIVLSARTGRFCRLQRDAAPGGCPYGPCLNPPLATPIGHN